MSDIIVPQSDVKLCTRNVNLYYGENHALKDINLDIKTNKITAFIGPSGCGKSTYLKSLNRMNDLIPDCKITGRFLLDGEDIYADGVDTNVLRRRIGMVFQKPNPFPMSIYDNIAYGPRVHGIKSKAKLDRIVEESLIGAAVFDEVKDRLHKSALSLSGGQQQKTAICRALYRDGPIVILDEPTAALDPVAEYEIYKHFNKLVGGKTAIYISHRLSSCKFCDEIAVFADDTIKEYGTHDELVKIENGIYSEMYNAQAQYYVENVS